MNRSTDPLELQSGLKVMRERHDPLGIDDERGDRDGLRSIFCRDTVLQGTAMAKDSTFRAEIKDVHQDDLFVTFVQVSGDPTPEFRSGALILDLKRGTTLEQANDLAARLSELVGGVLIDRT